MVTIATFNEPDKAKRSKAAPSRSRPQGGIHNEATFRRSAFMSRPQANAKIMVDDTDFERAQNLMIEWETSDPMSPPPLFAVRNADRRTLSIRK